METIATDFAPAAIGPYSQALRHEGHVYCSGQIAIDVVTSEMLVGGIAEQTRQVFSNLDAVLVAAGSSLDRVLKTTVFLSSMDDFAAMNAEYASAFGSHKPARATVEVSRLPRGALVEIECVAAC